MISLTSNEVWDPTKVTAAAVTPARLNGVSVQRTDNPLCAISEAYDESTMLQQMISAVKVSRTSNVSYLGIKNRHSQITAKEVARKFRCGLETARQTLKSMTQHGVRQAIHPLHRMY
jgi:hypothetical protein